MRPRAFLRAVLETRRRHGTAAAAWTLLEGVVQLFVRFEWIQIVALARGQAHSLPSGDGMRFGARFADEQTLRALQVCGDWAISEPKLAALRAGDRCLLSLVDGRLAGYTWVHARGRPEILPGLWLQLPAGWLYNFAAFTHPEFRGCGLQSWRHAALLRHCASPACAGLIAWVSATNHASRRGQRKSGYEPVGWIVRFGLGRHWLTWASPSLARQGMVCGTAMAAPLTARAQ